jgi:hypothetical protein
MIAFDLPDHDTRHELVATARRHGLLLLPCGARSIRFRPFLDINREDAGKAIELSNRASRDGLTPNTGGAGLGWGSAGIGEISVGRRLSPNLKSEVLR